MKEWYSNNPTCDTRDGPYVQVKCLAIEMFYYFTFYSILLHDGHPKCLNRNQNEAFLFYFFSFLNFSYREVAKRIQVVVLIFQF